jgi:hypothetical protein
MLLLSVLPLLVFGQSLDQLNKKIDSLTSIVESVDLQINQLTLNKNNLKKQIEELKQKKIKLDFEKEPGEGFPTVTRFMGGSILDMPSAQGKEIVKVPPKDTVLIFNWYEKPFFRASYNELVGYISSAALVANEKTRSIIYLTLNEEEQKKDAKLEKTHYTAELEEQKWADEKQKLLLARQEERKQELKEEEVRQAKRKQELIRKYGQETAQRILRGEYWIGMTDAMAKESVGLPDDNNRTTYSWGIKEQWVYKDKDLYLYFEDGILIVFQN